MENSKTKHRLTRQRRVVLEEIRKLDTHPTASELWLLVRKRLPKISLGTVYRNLEVLSEQGFIIRLDLGCDQRRFDGTVRTHYHVRCENCGKVCDIALKPLPNIEEEAQKLTNFAVHGHTLEFCGICPECQKRARK